MRERLSSRIVSVFVLLWLVSGAGLSAQQQAAVPPTLLSPVPRVVWFTGSFPIGGRAAATVETVTVAVYPDRDGGDPLWEETHAIAVAANGSYSLLLGATSIDGLPVDLFTSGQPRWLGVRFHGTGDLQPPRVHLASVPYALKAIDADTLGGRPASDYLLAAPPGHTVTAGAASVDATPGASANLVLPGVEHCLVKYMAGGVDVGSSGVCEVLGKIGIGTPTPVDNLHVAFNSPGGGFTGYAVQNTALSPTAYSGMLFYDHTGALGQFQGFNNSTHEYRINNIGRVSPGGAFNGSINFMTGGISRFLVASDGNISIAGDVVVGGNIAAKYQDVAEWVDSVEPLEPGTVVVIDGSSKNRVRRATAAYDSAVVGAVSAQPGIKLGESGPGRILVAQSGRVRIKADARYGAIRAGDLLVTSPNHGYAMRSKTVRAGQVRLHRPGTVLGKALEPLAKGTGEILVLLTLQ